MEKAPKSIEVIRTSPISPGVLFQLVIECFRASREILVVQVPIRQFESIGFNDWIDSMSHQPCPYHLIPPALSRWKLTIYGYAVDQ